MHMTSALIPAGLIRRIGALFYDWLAIIAIWFLQTALLLPFTHGEALPDHGIKHWAYLSLLYLTALSFFVYFWHKDGRTLGMRAWQLRLVNEQDAPLTFSALLQRALWAIPSWGLAGLGVLWLYFDPAHRAWHDRLSHTRVIVEKRERTT